jgi:hypothetical protein
MNAMGYVLVHEFDPPKVSCNCAFLCVLDDVRHRDFLVGRAMPCGMNAVPEFDFVGLRCQCTALGPGCLQVTCSPPFHLPGASGIPGEPLR